MRSYMSGVGAVHLPATSQRAEIHQIALKSSSNIVSLLRI